MRYLYWLLGSRIDFGRRSVCFLRLCGAGWLLVLAVRQAIRRCALREYLLYRLRQSLMTWRSVWVFARLILDDRNVRWLEVAERTRLLRSLH